MLHIANPFPTGKVVSYGIASLATGFFGTISLMTMTAAPQDRSHPVKTGTSTSYVKGASLLPEASETGAASNDTSTGPSTQNAQAWTHIQGDASSAGIVSQPSSGFSASEPVMATPTVTTTPLPGTDTSVAPSVVSTEPAPSVLDVQLDAPVIDTNAQVDGTLSVGL